MRNYPQIQDLNVVERLRILWCARQKNKNRWDEITIQEVARRGPWARDTLDRWISGASAPTIPNQFRLDTVLKSLGY